MEHLMSIAKNNSKRLLSICIPTYNRGILLRGLIENIFEELEKSKCFQDVQIVIVDGCSADNTKQIVAEFLKIMNIKYFRRKERKGVDKDILKCVEIADGEFCWLFSDDDKFTTGAIAYLIKLLREEEDLTGCFCNRTPYDSLVEKKVAEVKGWPGKLLKEDKIFADKTDCFKYIGTDFGFLSTQIVRQSDWQKVAEGVDFGELYKCLYLMVHIIVSMMNENFKWLYINKPLVKQRTANDSLLARTGIVKQQELVYNGFVKVVSKHYDTKSNEYKLFFKKMVNRLPRVVANMKSQNVDYVTQTKLLKLYYAEYSNYWEFWSKVAPIFIAPNSIFILIKKLYFRYCLKE